LVEIEATFWKSIIKKIMAKTIVFTMVMVKPNKSIRGPRGPGPRPPTVEGPPIKLLIFYYSLMNQLMTSF